MTEPSPAPRLDAAALTALVAALKREAQTLGFGSVGITHTDLSADEALLDAWLARGYQGEMAYLAAHGRKRTRPAELRPGTLSVISVTMDYLASTARPMPAALADGTCGYIARYALGRDYHKVMRGRLRALARSLEALVGPFGHRVFSDSAPVLEKALARNAGLGWIGKHTNLLTRSRGSWFFLGEIYTDLALPADRPHTANHCGTCTRCLEVCPTQAIVAPYVLDARRCIAYLTIESRAPIPEPLRAAIGNRIFGCDDCQTFCPWNREATFTVETDFAVRHGLDAPPLLDLWAWDESRFLRYTEGSALRRINFEQWRRNLAVALGNAPTDPALVAALEAALGPASPLVREHIVWALAQHRTRGAAAPVPAGSGPRAP